MSSASTARPLRADARRNRDAILGAARAAFDSEGVMASLDGIALKAGVGNATLYRNFPTREDLLVSLLQESMDLLVANAQKLDFAGHSRESLAEWLFRLTWHLRSWQDLPTSVVAAMNNMASPVQRICEPLRATTRGFLETARANAVVAEGITAEEVFELVTILSWGVDSLGDPEATARRRVKIATAGIFQPTS
ncbi:MAG: transcriptional regulator [Glaciihabitans sp.]|nr:transcriptional regulator [Glaciihabitans sp.]